LIPISSSVICRYRNILIIENRISYILATDMTFRPTYNERKATQLAAYLLRKRSGEMYLLKLMKLLYIVDRAALAELGHPVTYDNYVSMDNGPVLSHTLNLMNGMNQDCEGIWDAMIAPRDGNKITIVDPGEVSFGSLSEAEMEIADKVFDEYGNIPRFELAEMTHGFPEWTDPQGSSIPIKYERLLQAVGYDRHEIQQIIENLKTQQTESGMLEMQQSEILRQRRSQAV
jgi:uncharacterized phage-associated protein